MTVLACAVVLLCVLSSPAWAAGGPELASTTAAYPTKRFHSEPWLHPPVVSMSRDPDLSSGDIFLTPGNNRGAGLMILNPKGQLVWFHSVAPRQAFNLEVQSYQGQPVLTWWQGRRGGRGEYVIADRAYRTLAVVRAGTGYKTDPHDFVITPQGTAWLVGTHLVKANLIRFGGPRHGLVWDKVIQEVDIATGRVLWQWDSFRHIPLNAGYAPPRGAYYDAYHLNSIQLLPDGNLLVSARSTWSVYEISTRTGRLMWTLGGKYSSFRVSPGARFEWQHAAHLSGSTLTVFDDAASPQEEPQSSAKVIRLNLGRRTARLVRAYVHSPPLLSASQGDAQRLPNGRLFVGWGSQPDFSEYNPAGRQILTGSFSLGVTSYRALRFPWVAHAPGPPAIAARPGPRHTTDVWASWNGATGVARWRVLGGASPTSLRPMATKPIYSFETEIRLSTRPRCVEVQALDGQGRVLGTSRPRFVGGGHSQAAQAPRALRVIPFPGTPDASPSSPVIFSSLSPSEVRSVTVRGTRSGAHAGRLIALPAGAGTEFVPRRRFRPGDRVSVSAALSSPAAGRAAGEPGANRLRFSFGVAVPRANVFGPVAATARGRGPTQRFHSAPGLRPPVVDVTPDPDTTSGDILLTPEHSPQAGPMILNARGQVLWFDPVSALGPLAAFNLQVQRYQGRPVLTWWRGTVSGQPYEDLIMDRSYRTVAIVRAADGYATDEHEFLLTPRGTAYISAFYPVQADLSSVGGPRNGTVRDFAIQEIDVRTGRLVWQWDALGHVPLGDSYVKPRGSGWYDYFHLNSIQQLPDGNLLVSARNTWAVYKISRATGRVIWTIGGKHSSFALKPGARFEWQHDARLWRGRLSVFDDAFAGGERQEEAQSSAKLLAVDQRTRTVSLIRRYTHSPPLLTALEGSVQLLPNHDVFVGWGGAPDFTEYTPDGRQIFNGSFALGVTSYRAFRVPWVGRPLTRPSLAISPGAGGAVRVWASWNGATNVSAWRVVGGPDARTLRGLGVRSWGGFETAIRLSDQPRYLAVQALNSRGRILRSSPAQAVPRHLDVFAHRAFVSASTGQGALPVGCFTGRTCHVRLKVISGHSVLADPAPARVFSHRGALISFRLSPAGLARLNSAPDHRLAVRVGVSDSSGARTGSDVTLVAFSSSGSAPQRRLHQSPTLHIVGVREFVSSGGAGAILTACYAPTPCQVRATVSAGGAQIDSSRPQAVGVNELAYVRFQLTPAGRAMLAGAPGNQLAAQVVLAGGGHRARGRVSLIGYR